MFFEFVRPLGLEMCQLVAKASQRIGGSGKLNGGEREADFAAAAFQRLGLANGRVIFERDSRNTVENARFTKIMAKPKIGDRWLLITSAAHMPRAVGLFRKVGFNVEPYPVNWTTRGYSDLYKAGSLGRVDRGAREWIGLFANWIVGNSDELFPGPNVSASTSHGP
jgi:uncharacterized SAM-binding protein YcdF (DUF218 family)